MSRHDEHERWDELAAGYALDALEPDEELDFAEHVRNCTVCAARLDEHAFVAAQLGALASDTDEARAPAWSAIRRGVVGANGPAPVVPLQPRPRAVAHAPKLLAAAAGILVLAGIGVVTWQATHPTTTPAARAIAACEHRTGCSVVRLHTATGAEAGVVLVADEHATMVPLAMTPPGHGHTYVLWQLLRTGSPTPVAAFSATKTDTASTLPMSYADTAAFAVSLEPSGTPPSRPTVVLATGNATA